MPQLPYRKSFTRLLTPNLGVQPAADVVHTAAKKYPALLAACPHSIDRSRLEKQVLPALALYQALLEQGLPPNAALHLLEPVLLQVYFGFLRQGLVMFSKLPFDPFPILRPALRFMAQPAAPLAGQVIVDSPQRLIVHTFRCPILEALQTFHATELTSVFCASDDWLASALPRIRWLRTTTLGRGGALCDFHWERG